MKITKSQQELIKIISHNLYNGELFKLKCFCEGIFTYHSEINNLNFGQEYFFELNIIPTDSALMLPELNIQEIYEDDFFFLNSSVFEVKTTLWEKVCDYAPNRPQPLN